MDQYAAMYGANSGYYQQPQDAQAAAATAQQGQQLTQQQQQQQQQQTAAAYAQYATGTSMDMFGYGWTAPANANGSQMPKVQGQMQPQASYGYQATKAAGDGPKLPGSQAANDRSGLGYGSWQKGTPGAGASFPQKKFFNGGGNSGFKRSAGAGGAKKPFTTAGKTPAMLLHEMHKDILERFDEVVTTSPKQYRCVLTVNGVEYAMDATSKKAAKQKAAELAVRKLHPHITMDPYEETKVTVKALAEALPNAPATGSSSGPPAKKSKKQPVGSAIENAVSLTDCLRKLCVERADQGPYIPVFDYTDTTPEENKDVPKKGRVFKVTLAFKEQGKLYQHETHGRELAKNRVVREALKELFNVSDADIRAIVRRHICGKLSDIPVINTLYQVAQLTGCDVSFKVDVKDDKGAGHKPDAYIATCTVIDYTRDKTEVFTSHPCNSKQEAKEFAAHEMLRTFFDIDPTQIFGAAREHAPPPPPASQKLSVLVAKNCRGVELKFHELGHEGVAPNAVFKVCYALSSDPEKQYCGTGKSKKEAKNAAALEAIKCIFKYDYDEKIGNDPPEVTRQQAITKMGLEVSEFAKREYISMCNYYAVRSSTEVAWNPFNEYLGTVFRSLQSQEYVRLVVAQVNRLVCFFLLNEKNEKRLIAIGSASPTIVPASVVAKAQGNSILHVDPIVIARRSLLRYLISQLEKVNEPNSIFTLAEDGKYNLRENLRLVMYSTYPPNMSCSNKAAPVKRLSTLGPKSAETVGDEVQTMEDIMTSGVMRIHSTADKIFKWTQIGLQGGLLSHVLHPLKLNTVLFGSRSPVPQDSLSFSLFNRLGNANSDHIVDANNVEIQLNRSCAHVWTREIEHVESLDVASGRTNKGSPSRVCKASVYEAFQRLNVKGIDQTTSYVEAKARAVEYQKSKDALYNQLAKAGWGTWQRKPAKIVDFTLGSSDGDF